MGAVAVLRSLATPAPTSALAPVARFRVHPKIELEHCYLCGGRGFVLAVRNRQALQERCCQCSGRGTIVTDNA